MSLGDEIARRARVCGASVILFKTLSASSSQPRSRTALTKSLCGSVVIEDCRRMNELQRELRFGAAQFRKGGTVRFQSWCGGGACDTIRPSHSTPVSERQGCKLSTPTSSGIVHSTLGFLAEGLERPMRPTAGRSGI